MKTLIPVDGSESSLRALKYVLDLQKQGLAQEIHLINVQVPLTSGHAKMFISGDDYNRYCKEDAGKVLASARAELAGLGVSYHQHILVGHIAETIARFAREQAMDAIVMGARGTSPISDLVLGSVAGRLIHLATMPVTLVK